MKNHPAAVIVLVDTAINRISYLNNQASEYRQVYMTIRGYFKNEKLRLSPIVWRTMALLCHVFKYSNYKLIPMYFCQVITTIILKEQWLRYSSEASANERAYYINIGELFNDIHAYIKCRWVTHRYEIKDSTHVISLMWKALI